MVSDLGQGAAAYSARITRNRKITRLSTSLSSLAQIGEQPASDSLSPPSPKRWTRDVPGKPNDLGDIPRSGSPLRLSSSHQRTAVLTARPKSANSRIFSDVAYYSLIMVPIVTVIAIIFFNLRADENQVAMPAVPRFLESSSSDPAILEALKEYHNYVAQLSKRVADLEHVRIESRKIIEDLRAKLIEHENVQSSLLNRLKGQGLQDVPIGNSNARPAELDLVMRTLDVAKSEFSVSISELNEKLEKIDAKKSAAGSIEGFKKLIDRALYKQLADGTELVDYALESTGGSIVAVSGTHSGMGGSFGFLSRYFLFSRKSEEMIRASVSPGQCWPMLGDSGFAVIQLSESIIPTAITLEHVAPEIAPHFESSPKDFALAALDHSEGDVTSIQLGSWKYLKPASGEIPVIQTFKINTKIERPVSSVNFTVSSNYGGNYTCIYRLRIHGRVQS